MLLLVDTPGTDDPVGGDPNSEHRDDGAAGGGSTTSGSRSSDEETGDAQAQQTRESDPPA